MHCQTAIMDLDAIKGFAQNEETRQTYIVWSAVWSLVSNAAMVSKYLYPIKGGNKKRGRELCRILGVEPGAHILSRKARNNVEHHDERLDNWCKVDAEKIIEMVFEDREGFDYLVDGRTRVRRALLTDEMVFISEDQDGKRFEVELVPLSQELQLLKQKAEAWVVKNSPYKFIFPR